MYSLGGVRCFLWETMMEGAVTKFWVGAVSYGWLPACAQLQWVAAQLHSGCSTGGGSVPADTQCSVVNCCWCQSAFLIVGELSCHL